MTRTMDKQIRASRRALQNPWAHLNGDGEYEALSPAPAQSSAIIHVNSLLKGRGRVRPWSRREIETTVRHLHKAIWRKRGEIFGSKDVEPFEIIDPVKALQVLGYDVALHESLGQHAAGKESYEVAGIMDRDNAEVRISRRFVPAMRNFTAAHELAHAVLHEGSGLHRDRAPDGSPTGPREPREAEADIFASLFLLPAKLVRAEFAKRFLAERFELTEETAFALSSQSLRQLHAKCRSRRDLARLLADAHQFNSRHFGSLAERFGVSVLVMAIRIEELNLV